MQTNLRAAAAIAVEYSENGKIGKCSATWVSQGSCPRSCVLFGNGCYAELGKAGMVTRRLNASPLRDAESIAREEAAAIDGLLGYRFLRLHAVGDARTATAARIVGAAAARYAARGMQPRRGKKTWTYTHAAADVPRICWGTAVSVLASCETTDQAKAAMRAGYAAALVVDSFKQESAYQQDGVTLLPCPAQTKDDVTCESCGLCRDDDRLRKANMVIAFAAHGTRLNTVKRTLKSLTVL